MHLNCIDCQDRYGHLAETEQDGPVIQYSVPTQNLVWMSRLMMFQEGMKVLLHTSLGTSMESKAGFQSGLK